MEIPDTCAENAKLQTRILLSIAQFLGIKEENI